MYIGRIVACGMTPSGKPVAAYRVSSRSFPNRTAHINGEIVSVIPRKGFEADLSKNPYIAYNCVRKAGRIAIVTNGSHTDPITERIASGMSMRDAFAYVLTTMDFEHDSLDTPRIAAAVDPQAGEGALGIVRRDAVLVKIFKLTPGKLYYVSTYEKNAPCIRNIDEGYKGESAMDACDHVIKGGVFADFELPVTAAAAVWNGTGYEIAARDAD